MQTSLTTVPPLPAPPLEQEAVGLQREIGDLAAQRKDKADQLKVVRESLKRVDAEIQAATRR